MYSKMDWEDSKFEKSKIDLSFLFDLIYSRSLD